MDELIKPRLVPQVIFNEQKEKFLNAFEPVWRHSNICANVITGHYIVIKVLFHSLLNV